MATIIPGYPFNQNKRLGAVLNAIVDALVRNGLADNQIVPHIRTDGGVVLMGDSGGGGIGAVMMCRAPVTGIAAGATAAVTRLSDSESLDATNKWDELLPAHNPGLKCCCGYDETGTLIVIDWGQCV